MPTDWWQLVHMVCTVNLVPAQLWHLLSGLLCCLQLHPQCASLQLCGFQLTLRFCSVCGLALQPLHLHGSMAKLIWHSRGYHLQMYPPGYKGRGAVQASIMDA